MTTNTIQPTNLDIAMEEIDTLVSNFKTHYLVLLIKFAK